MQIRAVRQGNPYSARNFTVLELLNPSIRYNEKPEQIIMSATSISSPVPRAEAPVKPEGRWLRNRSWDTFFMTMSVFLVPIPYIFYLIGRDVFRLDPDVSRNAVNVGIALLVGGPHMYATFLRTALDQQFVRRYPMLIRSSIIIPIVVISLAFLNLNLLLTVFFFWASMHVLHQVAYVVELYNHRDPKKTTLQWWSRAIDYALVLTCLFPIAALRISQNNFSVGDNDLTKAIPEFFRQAWLFYGASGIFFLAVLAYVVKTFREWQAGTINWPKTIFIAITVPVACSMSALENLDTAFQGLNTWHSFQYLALTFYIMKLRQQTGDLVKSNPTLNRLTGNKNSWRLYFFSMSMLAGSLIMGAVVYIMVGVFDQSRSASARFDTAYYSAILCFLWIHYYHDHFLFTDFEAIEREARVL